jgi:hypothetical protein
MKGPGEDRGEDEKVNVCPFISCEQPRSSVAFV